MACSLVTRLVCWLLSIVLTILGLIARACGIISRAFTSESSEFMTFPQLVKSHGYDCYTHSVTTGDGYILTLFRIRKAGEPLTKHRPVAVLWHGLLDSAYTWIYPGRRALPFILCDEGYDVWLGNNRGNYYSKRHSFMLPTKFDFWQFSFDEFAQFDLPDSLDYIRATAAVNAVAYIGHSEGTTQMFALLSERPEVARHLTCFVALGPAVVVRNARGLMKRLAGLHVDGLCVALGLRQQFFGAPKKAVRGILAVFCHMFPSLVDETLAMLCGPMKMPLIPSSLPEWVEHEPCGTSVMNVVHWAQLVRAPTSHFPKFNYGETENLRRYGQAAPPCYDLDRIPRDLPVLLLSGSNDSLATPKDVAWLYAALKGRQVHALEVAGFDHTDLVWSPDCVAAVFMPTREFLTSHALPSSKAASIATSLCESWCDADHASEPRVHSPKAEQQQQQQQQPQQQQQQPRSVDPTHA